MGYEIPAYVLSVLTATGGIVGYVKGKSVPSAVAGCSVGFLYALGGARIQNSQAYGEEAAIFASVILGGASIPRAIRLQKPVPIGLSVLAIGGLLTFSNAYLNREKA